MACKWGELLDLIKTVGSVETTIADIKVRVVSANRRPEQQPKGTGSVYLNKLSMIPRRQIDGKLISKKAYGAICAE